MSNPTLRINTADLPRNVGLSGHDEPPRLVTPSHERPRTLSQAMLPSLLVSGIGTVERPSTSSNMGSTTASHGVNKARNESRKLLSHILSQLHRRPKPPPVLDPIESRSNASDKGIGAVVRTMKGMAPTPGGLGEGRTKPEDSDDEEFIDNTGYNTDVTFDLMTQLRDVLLISVEQGWDLFVEGSDDRQTDVHRTSSDRSSSSFLRRRSMQGGSRSRSRSASPQREVYVKPPELLAQCISVLTTVISNDCRYQVSVPKLKRPPNALQAITLDVAQFLLHAHWHSPKVISQIGFAVIQAFQTFRPAMHTRLLTFFDECIVGGILEQLGQAQGMPFLDPTSPTAGALDGSTPPMVSIQVDEAHEDSGNLPAGRWRRWSSASTLEAQGIRSTLAPDQDLSVYYLSSLVPPLLAAVLEHVDLTNGSPLTVHRLHRLFSRLINGKPDTYLDLLGVIAYHSPTARKAAITLLLSYWPKAVGHLTISRPLPSISYSESLSRNPTGVPAPTRRTALHDHPYHHQFVPWRFSQKSQISFFEGFSRNECRVCTKEIRGFGLNCPFCTCSVHFDCYDYPEGSFFTQYAVASEPDLQRVAVHRFCHVSHSNPDGTLYVIRKGQHSFRPVNIFSLALCFICRNPLWGCVLQGLKCTTCRQFIHSSCLSQASHSNIPRCRTTSIDSTYMTISWIALRQSFADYYPDLLLSQEELECRTYEEVSVFYSILWAQLQILDNGIALGSVVVTEDQDDFELHYLVQACEDLLDTGTLTVSNALSDYFTENRLQSRDHSIYFDWNTLAFLASVIKIPDGPHKPSPSLSFDFLHVRQPGADEGTNGSYPYEVIPLAYLRDQLGDCLNMFSDAAAKYFLSHLHHLGLLSRLGTEPALFGDSPNPQQLQCCFPLPFGFDVSADIETLVSAIEGCLVDLDLSINEIGLLLLVRRFWPDGMLTEYSYRRLTKAVLWWVLSEDDNLMTILRDYVARGRSLPGVRAGLEAQSWPAIANNRPVANTANNGGDYVASRRLLLTRYAAPWMLAFHDQDIAVYANLLYDLLAERAESSLVDEFFLGSGTKGQEPARQVAVTDKLLRLIIKTCQSSVVFTAFDDLFNKWLLRTDVLHDLAEGLPSLPRLFNRESEAQQRQTVVEYRTTVGDLSSLSNMNPMNVMMDTIKGSKDGFERGLHWLCLFISSGVDVPVFAFMQYASLATQFQASLDQCSILAKAALWACFLKSLGRQELQTMIASLHSYLAPQIIDSLRSRQLLPSILCFLRQSLATCLLLYGCDRQGLINMGMILEDEVKNLPARRKMQIRADAMSDPIIFNPNLMENLKSYVDVGVDEVSSLVAKFLYCFANEANLVESYEVDNFVLRNGVTLCSCVWQFYGIEVPDVSITRTSLLLRTLVVDPQPFQGLISELLSKTTDWTIRLQTVSRLFRMILDVTSPAFVVEDRQWQPSVIDIFFYFFSALWTDDREEIRLAVETWSQTLLPAHFNAITACWNSALEKAPISERVRLVTFLVQLRSHFPTWRVLSWGSIIEALLDGDFLQRNGEGGDGAISAHLSMYGLSSQNRDQEQSSDADADIELTLLQVSLVSLSLRMIADGINIDIFSLLKIKSSLVRILGFKDISLVQLNPEGSSFHIRFNHLGQVKPWVYPCLDDLMLVLDASSPFGLSPSSMGGPFAEDETPFPLLVGSVFVDVVFEVFIQLQDLAFLPFLTLKNLLKTLVIIIYKHNFDAKPLRHLHISLRAVARRTLDLLLADRFLSYELRQLALSISQAFIKKWPYIIGNFLCDAIEATAKLLVSLNYEQNGDDVLVAQGKAFLESVLSMFSMSGVINALFKRQLDTTFFLVLKFVVDSNVKAITSMAVPLRDSFLRDTLTRAVDNDMESFQVVIENINRYVEIVHHSYYSTDLLQFVGHSLTIIARKTADWHADSFDPSPLIFLASTLIQHNKLKCRDLLGLTDTFLRATMVRFHVSSASITRILQVTTSLYRKMPPPEALASNQIALSMIDLLSDGLYGKSRISSTSVNSLVEAIFLGENDAVPLQLLPMQKARLADAGLYYLKSDSIESFSQMDFVAAQAAARMVLRVADEQIQILENLTKPTMAIKAWNLVLLAALTEASGTFARLLLNYFQPFSQAYYGSLSAFHFFEFASQDVVHADISRAYASIKLWLLLAKKATVASDRNDLGRQNVRDEGDYSKMVWNELWPPFESIVLVVETDAQNGRISALASTVLSSVADLFLFLRQSHSVIAMETSAQVTLLNRLKALGRSDSKITRVLRTLTETSAEIPLDAFVSQTKTEIWAEEKLEAAKRQEMVKATAERNRSAKA